MTQTPVVSKPDESPAATTRDGNSAMVAEITKRIEASGVYVGTSGFVAQALGATTLDEATATDPIEQVEAHIGERLRFDGCTFADSDLDGTVPFYAVCDVVGVESGEMFKMSCGGTRVVATLLRAVECKWFPFDASIESIALGAGKNALNLVPSPEKVTDAKRK